MNIPSKKSLNIHKLCRLCQNKIGTYSILQDNLTEKISKCTRIKIDNDNTLHSLPSKICNECKHTINAFYQYLQLVLQVDCELREKLKENELIKSEKEEIPNLTKKNNVKVLYKCFLCPESYQNLNNLLIHQRTHREVAIKEEEEENSVDANLEDQEGEFNDSNICASISSHNSDGSQHFKDDSSVNEEIININVISDENNEISNDNDLEEIFLSDSYDIQDELLDQEEEDIKNIEIKDENDEFNNENYSETILSRYNSSDQPEDCKDEVFLLPRRKLKEEFVCKWINCNKTCSSKSVLKVHEMKHENIYPFLCEVCGKGFTTRNSLRSHERIHSTVKFKCESCNFSCRSDAYLKLHTRKHHDMVRYYCDQCTKAYLTKCSLERHQLIHTGIKEYQCETCPSAFYTRKELLKHQRYHQGVRLYHCNQCFKSFFEKHHLTIHLRIHTGERPYRCTIKGCTKAFSCSQKLTRHQKTRHN